MKKHFQIIITLFLTATINNIAVAALNDTGITTCSNATQNGLPCPVAGFPGQDAEFGTNSFNFTKIDANGNAMPVTATNHSCIQDNVTGLMWEVKTDDGGLRDKDNDYTFDQAAPFAANVNAAGGICGFTDWRVPNPQELVSIVDYSIAYPGPTINENFFPENLDHYYDKDYWTNLPSVKYPGNWWIVDFNYGDVETCNSFCHIVVRLVRGEQWLFSLSLNSDGSTVTDQTTRLMWAKCAEGLSGNSCTVGSRSYFTWSEALTVASNSNLAGYNDWRLPNVKELHSLVDYTTYDPGISAVYFPNTPLEWFWTSSPSKLNFNHIISSWAVNFGANNGGASGYAYAYTDRIFNNAVRLVRDGQPSPSNFTVTPSAGSGGRVSPDAQQTVTSGATTNFTVTPNTGYTKNTAVSGTCQQGNWNGDVWTTGTITANCTVNFSFNVIPITAPTVTTNAASNITQTSATLNGSVLSSGATATVSFDFGTTTSYGTNSTATPSTVYSASAVAVSANKTGLTCGTTYHFRTKAVNSAGTSYGLDQSFTTSACIVNGVCGNANGSTVTAAPTANLCNSGTASAVTGTGPWTWTCNGANGGTTATCSANIATYTVTATAGSGGTVSPGTQTVKHNAKATFTVTPNTGYNRNSAVTSTCPAGSWSGNVWTTGAITASCTVSFSFTLIPVPINGVCGTANGATFTTAPTTNLCSSGTTTAVTGTGPWNWNCNGQNGGSNASCSANLSVTTYTVTPSAGTGGTVNPNTPQTVNYGATKSFTVTANSGYRKNTTVTGTCPQGNWVGETWTTGAITAHCSVNFSFIKPDSWLYPATLIKPVDQDFNLELKVNSHSAKVGSYSYTLNFDQTKLLVRTDYVDTGCTQGVCPGSGALDIRTNIANNQNGTLMLSGSDAIGKGPSNDLQLLIIHFRTRYMPPEQGGRTDVSLVTNALNTLYNDSLGLVAQGATVIISPGLCGDADGNLSVNIIDALAIARDLVGLPPPPTVDEILADVNENARIDINDALMIARYSIGLVIPPEVCNIGQAL